jgi:hypothetical protein
MRMFVLVVGLIAIISTTSVQQTAAQTNSNFNVQLIIDYRAATQSVELFRDQYVNTRGLAELRGNRIAAATTATIDNRHTRGGDITDYLDSLRYHQIIRNDIYHLEEARANVAAIDELLQEMQHRNFSMRVAATVEQIFPADATIDVSILVYVVALGHENVDAYVRRIIWHDNIPQFVGEDAGELTIVVNLAHVVSYGPDVESRFKSILGVVAHEVFHAAFSSFKERSPIWQSFYKNHNAPIDALLDLIQNEGIAYYLSFEQRGYVPSEQSPRVIEAFQRFNHNATELLSDTLTPDHAYELLRKANLSGASDNYGTIVGLTIARQIDLRLGRATLIQTLSADPYAFVQKYSELSHFDNALPQIAKIVLRKIR